jgi:hypothetical protein
MVTDQEFKDLKKRVDFLYQHLGLTYVPAAMPADDPRIVEALKKGNMNEAVKIHRQIFDSSLQEATQATQEVKRRLGL